VLVIDASVAVAASHSPIGLARLTNDRLVAPHLLTVETSSVLHEMVWRREIEPARGRAMLARVLASPVKLVAPDGLTEAAWEVSEQFGWAKTYDAHYVALARLLQCQLVTLDERLLRGVERLGIAVRPRDI
jgi:predicted nucleic acid-binding protein